MWEDRRKRARGTEQETRRSIERCRRRVAGRLVTYIITVQCRYANVCSTPRTHLRIRGGGRRLHIIRFPRRFYACERTALSLAARHWLFKGVLGAGRVAFRPGDHGAPAIALTACKVSRNTRYRQRCVAFSATKPKPESYCPYILL